MSGHWYRGSVLIISCPPGALSVYVQLHHLWPAQAGHGRQGLEQNQ
uniref:DCAF1 n=1 Tax=Arundo donax TaxID=35708 RepID=A0A0A9EPH8_ARUDO